MILQIETVLNDADAYRPFLDRLETIYRVMDGQYHQAAGRYGFECRGCDDNCCRTRFYHYTLAEYLYLHQGLGLLDKDQRRTVRKRAGVVRAAQSLDGNDGNGLWQMCPVNVNDRCLLYEYRPMICRLHGIPYQLRKPGSPRMQGSGCLKFAAAQTESVDVVFDRTPLYAEMAGLERSLRQSLEFAMRVKMTVADMFAETEEN